MYDVIIVGTGPAGLMSGVTLSKSNLNVLVLEKNKTVASKLLITGNGRCNFTNLKENRNFIDEVSYNKKYLYSTINLFGPREVYEFFAKDVKLKEEFDNRVFPVTDKSSDILNSLMKRFKYSINYNEEVIEVKKTSKYIEVITSKNSYKCSNLIIATGGASYVHTGSSGDHMNFAKMLSQPTIDLFPAEVGIKLANVPKLYGTSISNVIVKAGNVKKEGFLLYTHLGLSGEAIMKISEFIYLNKNKTIEIDLLPNISLDELNELFKEYRDSDIVTLLTKFFPKKFSKYLLEISNIESNKIKQINHKDIILLINKIKSLSYEVLNVDSLKHAYVTGGGIDLKFINTKNFESKINEDIYFVGECLDIHGPIGGYNITLALSTGYSAAFDILNK